MDKRAALGAKPPTKKEEPKKPATSSPRTGAAGTSRTSGTTISKPPTRPVAMSANRAAGRTGDNSDENKRPWRTSMVSTASTRTAQPDSAADRSRRSALGGPTTSIPPKRPATSNTSSRTSPKSSSKTRTATTATSRRVTPGLKSPTNESLRSSGSINRPISRDTIPEEVDQQLPSGSTYATEPTPTSRSPPKIEIRNTPALRPQAASDAGLETRRSRGHFRTQSIDAHMLGLREREAMQSMLRESAAHDSMTSEIKQARAEMVRLEKENHRLREAARSAEPEEYAGQNTVELHAVELQHLKASHISAVSTLESAHAAELEKIHAELDMHRSQSSKLKGVEEKIKIVEKALQESRTRALRNEEGLQQTILRKDADYEQLANVVEELKSEIEKCQAQLDEDMAKEEEEKEKALRATQELKTELEKERQRNKESEERLGKERQESEESTKETVERVEQEVENLRQSAADAEKAARDLQSELDRANKHNSEQLEQSRSLLEESEGVVRGLKEESDLAKRERTSESKRAHQQMRNTEKAANDLRSELEALRQERETERQKSEEANQDSLKVIENLQEQIQTLQQDGNDSSKVVEDLQTQIAELTKLQADAGSKHGSELERLRSVIDNLQDDSTQLQQTHHEAVAAKDDDAKALNAVVEDLQGQIGSLEQQLEDARVLSSETVTKLDATIQLLREDAEANHGRNEEHVDAKETENTDLIRVIEKLQSEIKEHQQSAEDARIQAEQDAGGMNQAVEELQNEVQTLQHKIQNEQSLKQTVEEDFKGLQMSFKELGEASEELRSRHEARGRAVEEKQNRIEELLASLEEAEATKSGAQTSLSSLQDEMTGLQRVLETIQQDAAEQETHHANSLSALGKDLEETHERNITNMNDSHTKALEDVRESLSSEDGVSAGELQDKVDALLTEKASLEKRLGDAEMRHNRELEEEIQKHEASYRDLQNAFTEAKESQTKRFDEQVRKQDVERKEMQRTLATLKEGQAVAIETLLAEHDKKVRDAMDTHVRQIAEVEEAAARRTEAAGLERDRVHEARMATLEAEHAEALAKAIAAPMSAAAEESTAMEEPKTPVTPSNPQGLSHVFINHANAGKEETPLAYASDVDEQHSPISTYTKHTNRPRAQTNTSTEASEKHNMETKRKDYKKLAKKLESDRGQKLKIVEEENEKLRVELGAVRAEFGALQASRLVDNGKEPKEEQLAFDGQEKETQVQAPLPPISEVLEQTSAKRPAINGVAEATVRSDQDLDGWDGTMTLEGTLESLRVQTEHLLEVHDDILAENRRWSRTLGMRKEVNGTGGSPLKAAS